MSALAAVGSDVDGIDVARRNSWGLYRGRPDLRPIPQNARNKQPRQVRTVQPDRRKLAQVRLVKTSVGDREGLRAPAEQGGCAESGGEYTAVHGLNAFMRAE